MDRLPKVPGPLSLITVFVITACVNPSSPLQDSDPQADSETGSDGDVSDSPDSLGEDGGVDGGEGGVLTLVLTEMTLLEDRICDLDGDGTADNALADLGSPSATLFAVAINAALAGAIEREHNRVLFHFPWVDDASTPNDGQATLIIANGTDADHPDDVSNDYGGTGAFFCRNGALDPCGEPSVATGDVQIAGGELSTGPFRMGMPFSDGSVGLHETEIMGSIGPAGSTLDTRACGYMKIAELGGEPGFQSDEMSVLEEFLLGGASFGLPALPGLEINVDLDGDGVERFVLDGDGRIESCIDGDLTSIGGRDCWRDERMADGMALTFGLRGVGARFAGREPAWESSFIEACVAFPEESLFDSPAYGPGVCAELNAPCDPLATGTLCCSPEATCAGRHGGDYRCLAPCEPARCGFGPFPGRCELAPPPTADGAERICLPVGIRLPTDPCSPGAEGCETRYGDTEGTRCFVLGEETACLEGCEGAALGCDEGYSCLPLRYSAAGVCIAD